MNELKLFEEKIFEIDDLDFEVSEKLTFKNTEKIEFKLYKENHFRIFNYLEDLKLLLSKFCPESLFVYMKLKN